MASGPPQRGGEFGERAFEPAAKIWNEHLDLGLGGRIAHAPDALDEDRFASLLYTTGQPDPDLLIRTSGELRVSNFLLWQITGSRVYFTDKPWPDFDAAELDRALALVSGPR